MSFSGFAIGGGAPYRGPAATASDLSTLAGWTVGAGLEWTFAPQWSLKGEYLYYDLGDVTLNQTQNLFYFVNVQPTPAATLAIQSVAHYHGNIARIGVNYHF